jgi:hypothetical protein
VLGLKFDERPLVQQRVDARAVSLHLACTFSTAASRTWGVQRSLGPLAQIGRLARVVWMSIVCSAVCSETLAMGVDAIGTWRIGHGRSIVLNF